MREKEEEKTHLNQEERREEVDKADEEQEEEQDTQEAEKEEKEDDGEWTRSAASFKHSKEFTHQKSCLSKKSFIVR